MSGSRLLTSEDVALCDLPNVHPISYTRYLEAGGYQGLLRAAERSAEAVRDTVKQSGLLGRGGAGFPTWKKWEHVAVRHSTEKYVVCNAAEDEPGTFKDRYLLRHNPHQILEGALIAAHAVTAQTVYLYINGRYTEEIIWMQQAITAFLGNAFPRKFLSDFLTHLDIRVVKSPGTYVAGEETAALEVIEGRVAAPRQKPPYYPAASGLYQCPTLVNNAETLAHIPSILREGPEYFRNIGNGQGTMLFTLTGQVCRPGIYERPLGTPISELILTCGQGIKNQKNLKAFFPGGPSNAILLAEHLNVPLDFQALRKAGASLGTGAIIVMSEETCMVQAALEYSRFFAKESCGQCPPCVLGLLHLADTIEKIENGEGEAADLKRVSQITEMIKGRGLCYLLTGAAVAVESILAHFRDEFEAHIDAGCPFNLSASPLACPALQSH